MRNSKGQFVKGFLQKTRANTVGAIPWNKGLLGWNKGHFVSEETKEKIVAARRKNGSYFHSEKTKKHLSEVGKTKIGVLNSFYGKKHTEEYKERVGQKRLGIPLKWSLEALANFKEKMSGENHFAWKGGVSKQKGYSRPYANAYRARKWNAEGSFTEQQFNELKKFYNYMCLCCKQQEPFIKLVADHIIPLVSGGSNYITNIQPLCNSCNCRKHMKAIDYRITYAKTI